MIKLFIELCYIIFLLNYVDGLLDEKQLLNDGSLDELIIDPVPVKDWPKNIVEFGQLSAVSFDNKDNVYVLHRGNRTWNGDTFLLNNEFKHINEGPITTNIVLVFRTLDGVLISSWGSGLFYMPHGLTVDYEGYVWITDVGLHQVFKFNSDGSKNLLTLGTKFVPGNDLKHFCKPTSVAVMMNGDFFVADGYCNTRIIKYSSDGKVILHWGTRDIEGPLEPYRTNYALALPHALALAEDIQILCVADRAHGRVICYDCHNGTFTWSFRHSLIGPEVFSVSYAPVNDGQLYVVNGRAPNVQVRGFVVNMRANKIVSQFGTDLKNPHDIAVSKDASQVYVVELEPHVLHKFSDKSILKAHTEHHQDVKNTIFASNNTLIMTVVIAVITTLFLFCIIFVLVKICRKRNESTRGWKKPAVVDKVFRLNKLTERQNIVQGFQRLKTDESDEDAVATVNI